VFVLFARLLKVGHRRHIALLLGALTVCILLGGAIFGLTQHIPLTTGLYWAITTATTVGYGDVTPKNPSGRIVASAVMLTCIPLLGATFALLTGATVSAGLRKVLNMGRGFPAGSYRIVVGMHPAVPAIIRELDKAEDAVVLVADIDPTEIPEDVHLVRGDPTSPGPLRRARPEGAIHALVTGAADGDVLVSAVFIHEQAPDLPVSALVRSPAVSEALRALGITQTVSLDDLVAHTMAKSLETPHAGDLLLELIGSEDHRLIEVEVDETAVGRPLSALRNEREGLVLGVVSTGGMSLGIGEDPQLKQGDKLLIAQAVRDGAHSHR
jgi:voltage-gated potassium channel